ncbi:hypothetical protein [Winogradskya humida]|uniref:Uncharacterized protein n=1 Tax=Winogradskya humida TaxID=113566 RepID=A0ABQ3ZIB9_9ACTN|nr:hypothetical protein [Actinoplanes humidus]GIE18340.1 hypothetical protein Ahu01nite_014420 [Actinoplanes humidus]
MDKFKARYETLGFNDVASLKDGTMWPTAFALPELTDEDVARIGALIKKAAGQEGRQGRISSRVRKGGRARGAAG